MIDRDPDAESISLLADDIRHRLAAADEVVAYWLSIAGDRDVFADLLRAQFADDPVAVVVVREARFDNPNAVGADLVAVLEAHRDACTRELILAERTFPCAIVLLARTAFHVPQVSSPVLLPVWFPVAGGQSVSLTIHDITWTAESPLSPQVVKSEELSEQLYRLETALIRRLGDVHRASHGEAAELLELIRDNRSENFGDVLSKARAFNEGVANPSNFRPSQTRRASLVARLWSLVQRASPEALTPAARALARALDLPPKPATDYESIAAVLARPTTPDVDEARRIARGALIMIASACQLITAAAHADQYGRYPIPLSRSLSLDLRRSMSAMEGLLAALD